MSLAARSLPISLVVIVAACSGTPRGAQSPATTLAPSQRTVDDDDDPPLSPGLTSGGDETPFVAEIRPLSGEPGVYEVVVTYTGDETLHGTRTCEPHPPPLMISLVGAEGDILYKNASIVPPPPTGCRALPVSVVVQPGATWTARLDLAELHPFNGASVPPPPGTYGVRLELADLGPFAHTSAELTVP